jgi:hypothetical protein
MTGQESLGEQKEKKKCSDTTPKKMTTYKSEFIKAKK